MKYHCLKICLTHVVKKKKNCHHGERANGSREKKKKGELKTTSLETSALERNSLRLLDCFRSECLRIEEERKKQGRSGETKLEFDEVGTRKKEKAFWCATARSIRE